MGKRSNFERKERDYYVTPHSAVVPLIPHLTYKTFEEPCAGNGALAFHLIREGLKCIKATDIQPQHIEIGKQDVFDIKRTLAGCFITNPPWDRKILHPLIDHLRNIAPTWLLFDADWMHTKQSAPYIQYCEKIVSVGRVKWIEDSKSTGKDNCAWYLFTETGKPSTTFVGRIGKGNV